MHPAFCGLCQQRVPEPSCLIPVFHTVYVNGTAAVMECAGCSLPINGGCLKKSNPSTGEPAEAHGVTELKLTYSQGRWQRFHLEQKPSSLVVTKDLIVHVLTNKTSQQQKHNNGCHSPCTCYKPAMLLPPYLPC